MWPLQSLRFSVPPILKVGGSHKVPRPYRDASCWLPLIFYGTFFLKFREIIPQGVTGIPWISKGDSRCAGGKRRRLWYSPPQVFAVLLPTATDVSLFNFFHTHRAIMISER